MQTFRADIDAANDNALRRKRAIWLSILTLLLIAIAIVYAFGRQFVLQGIPQLPDKAKMWELNLETNYTLVDRQGHIIGHRGPYIGRPLKISEMPHYLPNAFLAIEDERFYSHPGIDRKAILRAFFENAPPELHPDILITETRQENIARPLIELCRSHNYLVSDTTRQNSILTKNRNV